MMQVFKPNISHSESRHFLRSSGSREHAICQHKFTDQILLQHVGGIDCVGLFIEGIGGIGAGILQHDLVTTWMEFIELGQVIDLVKDNHPAGSGCAVHGNLLHGVLP